MGSNPKILIVDDEKDLCEILEFNLSSEGFETSVAHSAEQALKLPLEEYDLILLDVMMGEMSGYKMADKIRRELQLTLPIIFMTAKTAENDILTGFNVGGDDYISKPFSIKEMVARIKAVLKRGRQNVRQTKVYKVEGLEVDANSKMVQIDDEPISLTRKEFEIITLLLKHQGQYIGRNEILDRVWNDDVIVTERNVDVNIARLRKKIGKYGQYIQGKSGYGYAFKQP
ncbi:DNA-binding response regulator, OmpR family, contains REC and winged-helix (wHTH) domain [Draconibacterium orientale]|uniref:Chemotaxis protein CheY n=1 Tax=Draconibacterium orientale TaxID=1168034 RepID=X5DZW5_9BACT|nr:response regulator transcription factor [Draconibacterium orientale]AHW59851.1 chemotaxis protein CheY [Draconibacterium orientale]SET76503.1 DNA-binding response regulator, OmpR family, contains REC and winged-helix (wHTH) domain [Draconibacterium orientale]